ncbi:MAG TPA: (d)CMP kinase [Gammaproteobacteria bacterium]|nr:(d)CMP kinase [Gammaproteobacteria bacterium]
MTGPAPVIAIDGPSGSGKGTISRLVAQRLGWHHLDSGALYRILAHAAAEAHIRPEEPARVAALAPTLDIRFVPNDDDGRILLNGDDVTSAVRAESCGNAASKIAVLPEVRAALADLQRRFREPPGLVADGRDMGSVIFPDAGTKIFLTASARERAERRHKQLNKKGLSVSLDSLLRDLEERDRRDAERPISPLTPAPDAHVVDTTGKSIDAVVAEVLDLTANGTGRLRSF